MIVTGGKYKGRKIQAPDEKIFKTIINGVFFFIFQLFFASL